MAPTDIGVDIVGSQMDGLIKIGDGLLVMFKPELALAPPIVGEGLVRLQTDGLIEVGDRLLVLTKSDLGISPLYVGVSIFGPYIDGLIKVGNGALAACQRPGRSSRLNFAGGRKRHRCIRLQLPKPISLFIPIQGYSHSRAQMLVHHSSCSSSSIFPSMKVIRSLSPASRAKSRAASKSATASRY